MPAETEGMARTLSLDEVDPTFAEVAKALYGDAVDPRELWDVSKQNDGSELHVNDAGDKQNKRKAGLAAGLVAGSVAEGLGLGRAYQRAKEQRPKVLRITGAKPPRVTDLKGRVRVARAVAHTAMESKAGRIGEAAFQAGNFAVGLTAAHELAGKRKVSKGFSLKPINPLDVKRTVTLKARRPGVVAKDAGSGSFDPMTGERLGATQTPSQMVPGTVPAYDTQTGVKIPKPGVTRLKKLPTAMAKSVTWVGEISKVDDEKRQVFGWASLSEVNGEPVIDRQGDWVPLDEIESAAYTYVLESRLGGDMHDRVTKSLTKPRHTSDMIESMVFTPEKVEALGLPAGSVPLGWWCGFKVHDDEQWLLVKSGKRAGFSIHGLGTRSPATFGVDADPTSPIATGRDLSKGMPVVAGRLGGVHRGGPDAAVDVYSIGNGLQMRRIDASSHSAEVIKSQSLGDRSDQRLVHDSMSSEQAALGVGISTGAPEHPIAMPVQHPVPQPAAVRSGEVRESPLTGEPRDGGHGYILGAATRQIVRGAPGAFDLVSKADDKRRTKKVVRLRERVDAAVQPPAVKLKPVDSSAIKSMGYQRQTRRLAVEMHSRPSKPYQYRLRPLDAKKAEEAPSLGSHYSREIRGKAPHANHVRLSDRARLFADPPKKDVTKGLAQVADAAGDTALAVKRIGNAKNPGPSVPKGLILRPLDSNLGAAEHDAAVPLPVQVGAGPAGDPIPKDPLA